MEYDGLNDRVVTRLDSGIRPRIERVVKEARDHNNFNKYDSTSHFIRAALMARLKIEEELLK